jgi:sugar-specific transcriptional regulator TrmB
MTKDDEFIRRLTQFGLSEKEAQLYLHLLRYGPKTPSPLARSLKTYREDVHRTLTSLIEKGMVRPSLGTPMVYTAVDLETALETALKRHESEIREMEARKQELQELSKQQRFQAGEIVSYKILKSMKEVVTVTLSALASAEKEWFAVVPPILTVFSSLFFVEDDKKFIDRGGRIRFITDITYPYIELIQEHLDAGMEVRHFDKYSGLLFCVFDGKIGMSAINVAHLKSASLSQTVSVLWSDDPTYAQYLVSTFEALLQQSIPAKQRIQELLEQGPPV